MTLVSKDLPMRVKASSVGLHAEEYRAEAVVESEPERALDLVAGGFIDTASPLESLRNVCLLVLGAIVLKNAALVGSRATAIAAGAPPVPPPAT